MRYDSLSAYMEACPFRVTISNGFKSLHLHMERDTIDGIRETLEVLDYQAIELCKTDLVIYTLKKMEKCLDKYEG